MTTQLLEDLALANHILVNEGVLDGFGHISVRHPNNPERFFIARSMAPALVEAQDIVEVDLDGHVHDQQGRRLGQVSIEQFINFVLGFKPNKGRCGDPHHQHTTQGAGD